MTCFLASMYFPILCLSLTFQFCLNCLTVRIEPTVNLPENPPFDYGKLSIEKFYDVALGEFIYPYHFLLYIIINVIGVESLAKLNIKG